MVEVKGKDYTVESISKGKTIGKMWRFATKAAAQKKARLEYAKGKGVSLDYHYKQSGSKSLAQKGMKRTKLGKLYPKTTSDYGTFGKATKTSKKKQGYDARKDEQLGMTRGKESSKKMSLKGRRDVARATRKPKGSFGFNLGGW